MDDLGLSWIIMNFYTHRVYHGSSWIDPWARWDRSMAQRNVDFRCIPKFPALKILPTSKRGRISREVVVSRSQNKILVIYGDFRIGESSQQVENMMKTCVSKVFFRPRHVKAFNFYVWKLPTSWKQVFEPTPWAQPGVRWKGSIRCVDSQSRKWWQLRQGTDSGSCVFPVVVAGHWWKMTSSNLGGNCIVVFLVLRLFQPW